MREQGLNREIDDDAEMGSRDKISQREAEAEPLEQSWIDVTVPLRFFVKDGALALNSSSKAALLGFYNPCVREDLTIADARSSANSAVKPLLYVRYAYDGQVFEATFDDDQAVSLPSQYACAMGPVGCVY
ncbi:hypothetical protein PR003_g20733 [Phytophthora rubi]|uniref:DnaJ-like protein C11 C-terminal domain-containing protein n=1 Tax=Phytophthora rubi TaxID=129364 RepID=A0A6A4DVT5_9STRA|nr:hypothetical protein PR002_g20361 [Phytophthora rubi]KAE8997411.1 hypothetical protein PR001_g19587 [Phytophthora rubi]KAE9308470.1 hypothetical protein PR003_g20733 [Phytophthora rubi]